VENFGPVTPELTELTDQQFIFIRLAAPLLDTAGLVLSFVRQLVLSFVVLLFVPNQLHSMEPNKKTVVTLDMALYERAKQLEMTRNDYKGKWVLRLREMQIVMRTAGNATEDSGLEDAWNEADIYGPVATRQILEVNHTKRALEAHMTTVQALPDL